MKLLANAALLLSITLSAAASGASSESHCKESFSSLLRASSPSLQSLNVGRFPTTGENKHLTNELLDPSGEIIHHMSRHPEEPMSYVITPDDRMFLVKGDVDFDSDYRWSAEFVDSEGKPITFPIKTAGRFKFETANKGHKAAFITEATYGAELSPDEIARFSEQIDSVISRDPELSKRLHLKRPRSTAQVLRCSEAVIKRSSKTFVNAKLTSSLTLLTGGILIHHPERFDVLLTQMGMKEKEEGRNYDGDMLAADYVATAANSIFQGLVGYHISNKGVAFLQNHMKSRILTSFVARGATSLTSIGLQTLIYSTLTDNNAKGVGFYNIGYSAFSIVKSHYLDDFLVHKLPEIAHNACLIHPALKIIVGQRTIRLGEGLASTWLYLRGREALVGE